MKTVVKIAGLRFICEDELELWRAKSLLSKEKGTVAWIQREVHVGDVFYDIGASTGIYALLAALQLVEGQVVAFEPNLLSAASLLRNAAANGFLHRLTVLTSALHDHEGYLPFHYTKLRAGVSGSQLGQAVSETGELFEPEFTELKHATTVDRLIREKVIRPPTLVKLDVDGNEAAVLAGMEACLRDPQGPRQVQVEMHPETAAALILQMARYGFRERERHRTLFGDEAIARGTDPAKVFYNLIFERTP